MLAMDLGFMGPNYPISTACATGNYCILRCVFRCRCDRGQVVTDKSASAEPAKSLDTAHP